MQTPRCVQFLQDVIAAALGQGAIKICPFVQRFEDVASLVNAAGCYRSGVCCGDNVVSPQRVFADAVRSFLNTAGCHRRGCKTWAYQDNRRLAGWHATRHFLFSGLPTSPRSISVSAPKVSRRRRMVRRIRQMHWIFATAFQRRP